MIVGELIKALEKLDPSLIVQTEGCDCWGDVAFLEPMEAWPEEKPGILLCRSDGHQADKRKPPQTETNYDIAARVAEEEEIDAPLREKRHEAELQRAADILSSLPES